MKLTRKEFEAQLTLAKGLPTAVRAPMIASLKSAQVVEVDKDGVETTVQVEIVEPQETAAPATKSEPSITAEAIEKIVKDAIASNSKLLTINQPQEPAEKKLVIPATCHRPSNLKSFTRPEVAGIDKEHRAFLFGHWAFACITGNAKSMQLCKDHGVVVTKDAHAEGVNTTGGYLVPDIFGTDLIDLRERYGVVRTLFKNVPMTSDHRTDPRRVSGLTAYFVSENEAITESNKTWDQVSLTAKKLTAISRISNELNEDSVINIGDDLAGEMAYAFALKEDQCGLIGDGTSTYGGMIGVGPKIVNINGVDEGGGVIVATGDLFSEYVLGDFNKVIGLLPLYADTPNTCWVCHKTTYASTMQRLETAAGGVTTMEVRSGNRNPRPIFLGYPVVFSQVMAAIDTSVSQTHVLFGDFSLAASFGDRRGTTIAFSDSAYVNSQSVFERDQIAVRGTERFDINVHDVGSSTVAGPVVALISKAS